MSTIKVSLGSLPSEGCEGRIYSRPVMVRVPTWLGIGCPTPWLNIISWRVSEGVSGRQVELVGWVRQISLPSVDEHQVILWEPSADKRWRNAELALSSWLLELRYGSSAGLGLDLNQQLSWWFGLQTQTNLLYHQLSRVPHLQIADCATSQPP